MSWMQSLSTFVDLCISNHHKMFIMYLCALIADPGEGICEVEPHHLQNPGSTTVCGMGCISY